MASKGIHSTNSVQLPVPPQNHVPSFTYAILDIKLRLDRDDSDDDGNDIGGDENGTEYGSAMFEFLYSPECALKLPQRMNAAILFLTKVLLCSKLV